MRLKLGLLIAFALVAILLAIVDIRAVGQSIRALSFETLLLGFFATALALATTGVRWWVFLRKAGFPQGVAHSIGIRQIGQALNASLPGGVVGDLVQVFLVSRRPSLSGPSVIATIFSDRVVGVAGILVLVAATGSVVGASWPEFLWMALLGVAILVFAVSFVLTLSRLRQYANRLPSRFLQRAASFVVRVADLTMPLLKNYRVLLVALVLATAGQFLIAIGPWLILRDISPVPFIFVVPVISLASLVSLAPVTLGGIGLREWVFFGAFKSFGLGLEEAVGLSFAWLALTLATSWLLAGVSFMILPATVQVGLRRALKTGRNVTAAAPDRDAPTDGLS